MAHKHYILQLSNINVDLMYSFESLEAARVCTLPAEKKLEFQGLEQSRGTGFPVVDGVEEVLRMAALLFPLPQDSFFKQRSSGVDRFLFPEFP